MQIGESFRRFDHTLAQFQRAGYSNSELLLDATGGTTPLRVGASLAAMMRNLKIVHQRVRQVRYTGGDWDQYSSEDIELLPMGNPLEDTGLLHYLLHPTAWKEHPRKPQLRFCINQDGSDN